VVDNLGFPQVCVDKLNVFTTPLLIRQWSKNSFCYVLLNIELAIQSILFLRIFCYLGFQLSILSHKVGDHRLLKQDLLFI
jgi:hypothetical protein